MTNTFHVIIRKKDSIVWQGEAESLSSTNKIGDFDVLPKHTNFVGLIEKYIIIRSGKIKKEWPIDRGILSIKNNVAEAYLGY